MTAGELPGATVVAKDDVVGTGCRPTDRLGTTNVVQVEGLPTLIEVGAVAPTVS